MLLFTEKVKILKVGALHVMSLLLTRKSTYSNVHEGDTICVWYIPVLPWLNIYVPNE